MKAIYLCGTMLAVPAAAFCQAAQPPLAAPSSGVNQAEERSANAEPEIIITAERRRSNLQDLPTAASALTGDQLDDKAVRRISDLELAVPSLSVTDAGLTQSVNIRGIGIASGQPSVANGVATYIDGIFQPPIVTTTSFYDIASVEVLRGPQGTLVGSNSTGGAVFINTQAPILRSIGGYAQASYGSYDSVGAEGAINLPLGSNAAVRVAGFYRRHDSYFNDIGPLNNHPGRLEEYAGRLGVMWEPGRFRATVRAELVDRNSGGYAYRPVPGTAFAAGRTADIRTLNYNSPTLNHERGLLSSAELRYEFGGGVVLRSVSGYTNKRINNLYDSDATSLAAQTQVQFVRERQWSEEINLISPASGRFNWILGTYYQQNKIDVAIQLINGSPVDPTDISIYTNKVTTGAFAQGGYRILPNLQLQLGLRYSHFRATGAGGVFIGNGIPVFPPGGLQVADLSGEHSDSRMTGKISLDWRIDPHNLIYAFAARGYKPGGFNSSMSEFGPETVWDYEIGWKADFFGNRVRTQIGAYYMDYHDFQFDFVDATSGQTGVTNVASATIKGIEVQVQGRLAGFGFDGAVSYNDSKLGGATLINPRLLPPGALGPQCPPATPSNPPICFNYGPFFGAAGGRQNLFSPKWTYNFGIQYEFPLGGELSLTPRLNYGHLGSRFTNLFYSPVTDSLPSRGLLSAQLTLRAGERWSIEAYGTNLTDEKYVTGQFGNNEFYGAPREYGVRASLRF